MPFFKYLASIPKPMDNYSAYSDLDLSVLLRNRDSHAFKEVYERYNELLYIFAYRKLKDETEARDVVHDVFASLLEKGSELTLKTSLSAYLYKSVLNKILDLFRKQDTVRRYIDAGNHFIDVDSLETDYLIREKDILSLIEKEISSLPPRMREVYELRFREHLSNEQIGEKLGISPHTAATHIKLANKQLRNKLGVIIFLLYVIYRGW